MERIAIAYDKRHGAFIDEVRAAFKTLKIEFTVALEPAGSDEQDGSNVVFMVKAEGDKLDKLMYYITWNEGASPEALTSMWNNLKGNK